MMRPDCGGECLCVQRMGLALRVSESNKIARCSGRRAVLLLRLQFSVYIVRDMKNLTEKRNTQTLNEKKSKEKGMISVRLLRTCMIIN